LPPAWANRLTQAQQDIVRKVKASLDAPTICIITDGETRVATVVPNGLRHRLAHHASVKV
jgi:hypothetical protein